MSSASTQDGGTIAVMAPKDAEGRNVPLDTKVMYDDKGIQYGVCGLIFRSMTEICDAGWTVECITAEEKVRQVSLDCMYLTPPDSLKQLVEDIKNAQDACEHNGAHVAACLYSGNSTCWGCDFQHGDGTCMGKMLGDIAARIERLCGDAE